MNYAIVQILGKQHIVQPNFWYDFSFIKNSKIQNFILFNKILLINNNNQIQIGYPFILNSCIFGKIIKVKSKIKKIIILKTKPKKNYRRIKGYRSFLTRILINSLFNF